MFRIAGNNLQIGAFVDYEIQDTYNIRIRSTDRFGEWTEQSFVIRLSDVDEPASIVLVSPSGASLAENTNIPADLLLGSVSFNDDNLGASQLFLSGPDASRFAIIGNQLYLRAGTTLDYENQSSLSVIIQVDDPNLGTSPDASVCIDSTFSISTKSLRQ